MAEHDDGSPRWLPCGVHTSHSAVEEKRWASPKFQEETQRQAALSTKLVNELKKKGRVNPGQFPPFPYTYENLRIYEVKQHFSFLKKRLQRQDYLKQVEIYEKAWSDYLLRPPCRRLSDLPLIPSQVPHLTPVGGLTTPRTGGRHVSRTVQDRNFRIAELVKVNNTHLNICLTLDKEKWAVPLNWRKNSAQTWRKAYKDMSGSVHSLISKAATRKLSS